MKDEKSVLILTRGRTKKASKIFKENFAKWIKKYRLKNLENKIITDIRRLEDNLYLTVLHLSSCFRNYREFDNFLIELVQDYGFDSLDNSGLLVGHFDKNGNLWGDYQKFGKKEKHSKKGDKK